MFYRYNEEHIPHIKIKLLGGLVKHNKSYKNKQMNYK